MKDVLGGNSAFFIILHWNIKMQGRAFGVTIRPSASDSIILGVPRGMWTIRTAEGKGMEEREREEKRKREVNGRGGGMRRWLFDRVREPWKFHNGLWWAALRAHWRFSGRKETESGFGGTTKQARNRLDLLLLLSFFLRGRKKKARRKVTIISSAANSPSLFLHRTSLEVNGG